MSITPQDVHHLIDHNRDNPGLRQQDVSRIVRVLNSHRHPTTTATYLDDPTDAAASSLRGVERPPG